jgi:hypothetical protein
MKKIAFIIVGILFVIGIFYAFTSATITGYMIYEPYNETIYVSKVVQQTVEHGVIENETYFEEVCEIIPVHFNITEWDGIYSCIEEVEIGGESVCVRKKTECFLTIENQGEYEGNFTVGMYFVISGKRYDMDEKSIIIGSGKEEEFRWESIEMKPDEESFCDYIVPVVPTASLCEEVEKVRPVMSSQIVEINKTIEKPVTVIKNRTITKHKIRNRLFGYEQAFYWNY